ncbi:MAG: hypothetical protein PVI21_00495 [Candidatus Woesebacteria bacterium]|jgi:hypothetical protein
MMQITTNQPVTEQEIKTVEDVLLKFDPGYLPLPLFLQMTRLMVTVSIEMVPLKRGVDGRLMVLLTRREPDDKLWPDQWHNPGVLLRPTDSLGNYNDAFDRIFNQEIGVKDYTEPVFAGALFHKTKRGTEAPRIFWTELKSAPKNGQWFDVNNLPKDMIQSHVKVVELTVANFKDTAK